MVPLFTQLVRTFVILTGGLEWREGTGGGGGSDSLKPKMIQKNGERRTRNKSNDEIRSEGKNERWRGRD